MNACPMLFLMFLLYGGLKHIIFFVVCVSVYGSCCGGGLNSSLNTPFAVHYEKIRIHLRETATNSAKIHS